MTSRLGDLCLIVAGVLIYRTFGSLDYAAVFSGAAALRSLHDTPSAVHAASILFVGAALLKSAQFPLHGWLIEVMETPTPVSALLHAGIINAGGFLVLRFSEVISLSFPSLEVLAIVGGFTAIFGSVVMLTQTSIKVTLAYSTIAQMGFMMLECGLAAFPAAMLHIIAHSLYKAHAFLSRVASSTSRALRGRRARAENLTRCACSSRLRACSPWHWSSANSSARA